MEAKETELQKFLLTKNFVEYGNIKKMIVAECDITRNTFHNWRKGKFPTPKVYQEKIDSIVNREFGMKVFETNN